MSNKPQEIRGSYDERHGQKFHCTMYRVGIGSWVWTVHLMGTPMLVTGTARASHFCTFAISDAINDLVTAPEEAESPSPVVMRHGNPINTEETEWNALRSRLQCPKCKSADDIVSERVGAERVRNVEFNTIRYRCSCGITWSTVESFRMAELPVHEGLDTEDKGEALEC